MEAGDVFVRIVQLELGKNVLTHPASGAGGESRDRAAGEMSAQTAQLAVFRTKFVAPLGDAMGLINGEECDWNALKPADSIGARQPFRRKIQEPVLARLSFAHRCHLLAFGQRTVQDRGGDSHLRQLRGLVLHQGNQWGDDDGGLTQDYCG